MAKLILSKADKSRPVWDRLRSVDAVITAVHFFGSVKGGELLEKLSVLLNSQPN
jgi:hypothetical protein